MAGWNPFRAARNATRRIYETRRDQQALMESIAHLTAEVERLRLALSDQADTLAEVEQRSREFDADGEALRAKLDRQMQVLRAVYEDEPGMRRRLWQVREKPEYNHPFEVDDPLVTVFITTHSHAEALANVSIPSVLAQTHSNFELIVVGDDATPEVAEAVRSFDDPRIKFLNLTIRGPYPEDPRAFWHVAGTAPANEGQRLARGHWLAPHQDDDAFTPDHIEVLLAEARARRLELVWGRFRKRGPDGSVETYGSFPPQSHQFGVQAAIYHRGLRIFHFDLLAWLFGDPGDWFWVRRLMRAGVRMGMVDRVVMEYYPSQLWGTPTRARGLLDG